MAMLSLVALSGCGAKFVSGEIKDSYSPKSIDNAKDDNAAVVKLAGGLYVWKVDRQELVGSFKRGFSLAGNLIGMDEPDSLILNEGSHSLFLTKQGREYSMAILQFPFKRNHEYLVGYIEKNNGNYHKIMYWMEDVTEGQVVYGKKKTKENFDKEQQ